MMGCSGGAHWFATARSMLMEERGAKYSNDRRPRKGEIKTVASLRLQNHLNRTRPMRKGQKHWNLLGVASRVGFFGKKTRDFGL
jgi:hypothetical protein